MKPEYLKAIRPQTEMGKGMDAATVRAFRGLVIHGAPAVAWLNGTTAWGRKRRVAGTRGLVRSFIEARFDAGASRGRCRWCRRRIDESEGPRHRAKFWHTVCGLAYLAALGRHANLAGRPLIDRAPCDECGSDGQQVDHRLALSVAWASGEPRAILRAYTLQNLRWLCIGCHREKTRMDRAELARLQREVKSAAREEPRRYGYGE